jgi:DNA processing protein
MLGVGRGNPRERPDTCVVEEAAGAGAVIRAPRGRDDAPAAGAPSDGEPGLTPDERAAWVVLAGVHGVGPVSFERLLAEWGSAAEVLEAARSPGAIPSLVAASRGRDGGTATLSPETARGIVDAARDVEGQLAAVRRSGVGVVALADPDYPGRLRAIELPPPVLFVRGNLSASAAARVVAVVGTRRPTGEGRALAGEISEMLSRLGATVVSGLAFGIDAASHAAAVRAGAPTIAVIGGGHDRLYPAAHRGLARGIVDGGGAVISEFAPPVVPSRGTFPRRNRIISGLADAVIVVEAGARSGALTTAAWALEQGRGLHIVPGRIGDPSVAGSLAFLREASAEARIVAGLPELIEDLGLVAVGTLAAGRRRGLEGTGAIDPAALLASIGTTERSVAGHVAGGAGTVDELAALTGLRGAAILGALTSLEMRGLVLEVFGRYRPAGALAAWRPPGPGPGRRTTRPRQEAA